MNEYRWSDLTIGLHHEFSAVITPEQVQAFVALSGDCNPVHVDREYASSRGFKDTVIHGMLTSALYSTLVGIYLPGKFSLLHEIQIQFRKPAYTGRELLVSGSIEHLSEAYHRAEIRASIREKDGDMISQAKIGVGVYE
jgi:3-hydroxybutyryl-CoA dehydratase